MYNMSLVHLRIKPRQTCQHLHIGNHTKPLNEHAYSSRSRRENSRAFLRVSQVKIRKIRTTNCLFGFAFNHLPNQLFSTWQQRSAQENDDVVTMENKHALCINATAVRIFRIHNYALQVFSANEIIQNKTHEFQEKKTNTVNIYMIYLANDHASSSDPLSFLKYLCITNS